VIYQLVVPGPIEDVTEIRLLEWHGSLGHIFRPGDLIVELETHKALFEIRAAGTGVLRRLHCDAGEWRAFGALLAILGDDASEPIPADMKGLPQFQTEFALS
jgi:pyruvate/2-oxoglutarate dehydrogenase complex dihydrolipoamide acyltransferase (E2) component